MYISERALAEHEARLILRPLSNALPKPFKTPVRQKVYIERNGYRFTMRGNTIYSEPLW